MQLILSRTSSPRPVFILVSFNMSPRDLPSLRRVRSLPVEKCTGETSTWKVKWHIIVMFPYTRTPGVLYMTRCMYLFSNKPQFTSSLLIRMTRELVYIDETWLMVLTSKLFFPEYSRHWLTIIVIMIVNNYIPLETQPVCFPLWNYIPFFLIEID